MHVTLQLFEAQICVAEGRCLMSMLETFLVSVAASVVAYYICKWLDR